MKLYWNQMSQVFCVHHVIWVPGGHIKEVLNGAPYMCQSTCAVTECREPLKWRKKLRFPASPMGTDHFPLSLSLSLATWHNSSDCHHTTPILSRSFTLVLSTRMKGFLSVRLIHPISFSASYKSHQTHQEHERLIFHSRKRSTIFCREPIFRNIF